MSDTSKPLAALWPSYNRPLEIARHGVRAGGSELDAAIEQLLALRQDYRHVQAIGHELVLALLQAGRRLEAIAQLEDLEQQFADQLDEETLCRRGRCYKEAAGAALAHNNLGQARAWYRLALDRYDAAYALRQGNYPGINKATTLLLLADIAHAEHRPEECADLLSRMEEAATKLLADRDRWPKDQSDDNIWHLATLAEAHLLLRQWPTAEQTYRHAFAERNVKPFHRASAGKQARRILDAWRRLGIEPGPPVFPCDELFGPLDALPPSTEMP